MKITVFGATGKTGTHIVWLALAAGHQVVAYARDPAKISIGNPDLTVVASEIDNLGSLTRALDGADRVISALGGRTTLRAFGATIVPIM